MSSDSDSDMEQEEAEAKEPDMKSDRAIGSKKPGAGSKSKKGTKKMGRPKKAEGTTLVSYSVKVYKDELQRLEDRQKQHGFSTRRDYLKYLMGLDFLLGAGSSTAGQDTSIKMVSPPATPRPISKPSMSATASVSNASPTKTRKRQGTTVERGVRKRLFMDKSLENDDTFDTDPDKQDPEASKQIGWEEKLAKQKANEKKPLDFSESMRLLPDGYYKEWSKENIRVHHPPEAQPDKYGNMLAKLSKKNRLKQAPNMQPALEVVEDCRYIVEHTALLELISPKCYRADCDGMNRIDNPHLLLEGAAMRITIECDKGHEKIWWTCRRLQHQKDRKIIYCSINILLPAAVAVSGNNWQKAELLFKSLNLNMPSTRNFDRLQTYVVAPTVHQCWESEQKMIQKSLRDANCSVIVAGDGTFDSPGHSAMYCTYAQMITAVGKPGGDGKTSYEDTGYIYSLNVTDKRHTDLKSPNMELVGYLRSLIEMTSHNIKVDEMVTDGHLTIKAMMISAKKDPDKFKEDVEAALKNFKHLPASYIDLLVNICKSALHQMDIWHKARDIGKALQKGKVGKGGDRKNYGQWVRHIRNHWFWSCKGCNGDVQKLKEIWNGIMHHVRGAEKVATSTCWYDADLGKKTDKVSLPTPLPANTSAYESILNVVMDKNLQDELGYFVKFRHTGLLENFCAMALKYAPKRHSFGYRTMIMKKQLAAMDHNDAVHRPVKRDERTAKPVIKVHWSKAAGDWIPTAVKVQKAYSHIPHLMARILHERSITSFKFGRNNVVPDVPEDPTKIAKTIAKNQTPRRKAVLEHRKSRFGSFGQAPEMDEDQPTVPVEAMEEGLFADDSSDEADEAEHDSDDSSTS